MKHFIAFILILFLQFEVHAQGALKDVPVNLTEKEKPVFPGGERELRKYLALNLRYPNAALENKVEGYVILCFKINVEGKVEDIKVLKGLGSGCDEEAIRVARKMPHWEPAHKDGKAIEVVYYLPIDFELPSGSD
ncbi:energy transducer TonB [Taibaiella lutea]|uniref:Energy transducer TonB n=1 Tax=Taibaiella lutea TaxID=2608001 RepID=A0A5M6CRR0_9BACT|nr:energy transducer TonB [Taibaiella lutea]KAA5536642.1 energy transducer TonB [Taibaiella lutea]